MDYYTQKVQQAQQQQHRSSFDSRMESPRVQNRMSFDAASAAAAMNNALRHNGGAADQLRASFDARDLSSRASIDIKDVVRASFQKERSRSSVDGRDSRESPRLGGGSRYKDPPRSSVDGGRGVVGADQPVRSSVDSPRLSMRIKEAVRAAVEGRLDSVRYSFDSKESLRSASTNNRSREASTTPRSHSTGDSRLLVELRESPRLSRDAPRYSCDGRDVLRSTPALADLNNNNCYTNSISRGVQKASRETPRLSVEGRGGPPPVAAVRASVDERESPRLPRELLHASSRESSHYQTQSLKSDSEGKDRGHLQPQSNGEPRRRVPSLVARLMGLEDLPDDVKDAHHTPSLPQQMATSVVLSHETATFALQQSTMPPLKKPSSKESKLLKGLLQYNPRTEDSRPVTDSRHEIYPTPTQEQLKQMFGPRQPQPENLGVVHDRHQQPFPWNGIHQESPRPLKLSPKQLGVETMPNAYKQLEAREVGALRQKVANGVPKQLTEAVLTVLKNADDTKRMPMSYAEMESRLRQLRLRSSLQEHKSLRQILEAMQSKGLLNGASRPKDGYTDEEGRQQEEFRQQQDSRLQFAPKHIMLPKPQQECSPEAPHAFKVKHIQELRKLGSRLHEQVFGTLDEDSVKPTRPQPQLVSSKLVRTTDEQQSIVVMKPIVKPAKKTARTQNPALILESMPSARSPLRGRETGGRASPWGSPVRTQPLKSQPGVGFGRESTGRYTSEEGATAFKLRRERILARSGARDVHSEPSTPRSPKLITLPQSTAKPRSSSVTKETPEGLRHVKVNSSAGSKVGETGRRSARSAASKEETPKSAPPVSSRLLSGRDFGGLKKPHAAVLETEQQQQQPQKDQKSRRSPSEGKASTPIDRDGNTKTPGPGEVIILRNKSSIGKRVILPESETRTSTTTTAVSKKIVVNGGSKVGSGEKIKEKTSFGSAPTTPKGSRNAAEHGRKKEEQGGGTLDHVRVTDGDALDQSNVRSPLVGLTNRLQSTEVGMGELDREGQGIRTPRAGILVKKMFASQESTVQAEIIDIPAEQAQPSPVSVLDTASFHEEDVSPLALSKPVDGMQDHCDEKLGDHHHIVQQADTALQDWRHKVYLSDDRSYVDECSEQLMFLRESAKILPPQGELKSLILQSQAEKVYVRDVLVVSGATMGLKAINPAGGMIDNTVFDYLEEKQGSADYGLDQKDEAELDLEKCDEERERQVIDRRLLFDCVNDALTTALVPFVNAQPWMQGSQVKPVRKRPTGQLLVQQVWDELKSLPPEKPCDDICDSLYNVLQKDLVLPRNSWTEFNDEVEDIGLEVEKMIFKDLVEETLFDLTKNVQRKGLLSR